MDVLLLRASVLRNGNVFTDPLPSNGCTRHSIQKICSPRRVRIVTGYVLSGRRFDSRQGQVLSLPHVAQTDSGVKRLGHEVNHSLVSSAEVKNGGAVPPITHISLWHPLYLFYGSGS
jgi:hypothetical protein